ncbi:MAG: UPF0182 family protein [Candidatus Binataceae bacterium]|jgi:uncharacterized membrane protein (UPF0182 family)
MRPRFLFFGLIAALIVAFIVLSLADGLLVDLIWFESLGFRQVFTTTVIAEVTIFAIVWLVAFSAIALSGWIALHLSHERERLRVVRRTDDVVEVNLPELIRSLGDRIPWRLIVIGGAALLALFAAQGEAASWDVYLKALEGVPFGLKEPAFGRDVGFFVFTLPLLQTLRDLFMLVLFFTAAMTGALYWARGSLDFRESPPNVSTQCAAHLSVLAGIFFIERALNYWIQRYELTLHTNGIVFGLRYVDHVLWQPGLWLLMALALVAAAICFANVRDRGLRLPVTAAVIVFGPAVILTLLQPVIERLRVKPDELRIEQPYLERNIAMTRRAFDLDAVDTRPFAGLGKLTQASLDQDAVTIKNIRLWDPRPLIATYQQLQNIRLYYNFLDVDIDRYWIDHDYTQVMLSARELNVDLLPDNAQTWVNRHLKFTHGYGLVMSPVNTKDQEGLPVLAIKNIPPQSDAGLKVTQPGIYYGEEPDVYSIVKAQTPEFDYPSGNDNVTDFYKGDGGVQVSGFWRRLLFSFYYRDVNLLVTENIIPGSRILFRRNISDRIRYIAPFINQDRDPYVVLRESGQLNWIVDGYTYSDHYPYSQINGDGINYIRNSVKVVIDAYSGRTDFYVSDPDDPLIRTWQRIYPAMFKPMSEMPADLRAHIRYPEDFFLTQAEMYGTYHMKDPATFYNREDLWTFPRENYSGETVPMQPYYVIMRLPGETRAEYVLMLPMVPQGRDNMIAWLAARCDGADYGHLFEFAFSKDRLFYGPYQIQARINQNPEISQQYSLWNQMGSKVILGNLLVIPLEDSLLYVEPLYIRAENGQLPELKRVLASYGDRTVMGTSIDSTLAALFKGAEGTVPIIAASVPPSGMNPPAATGAPPPPASSQVAAAHTPPELQAAATHYSRAIAALRQGDWTAFGAEMRQLGDELGQPADSGHH